MTVQLAVRFPDSIVTRMQEAVDAGWAPTRSSLIVASVERELRRAAAARDRAILEAQPGDDDLDGLVAWTTAHVA